MSHVINWFEIPTVNFKRAVQFYEQVFATQLKLEDMGEMKMAIFPGDEPTGSLIHGEHYTPNTDGCIIYLNAPQLDALLERLNNAGGKCVFGPYTLPRDIGRIAHVLDCEGNRIGLHEPPAA